MSIKMYCDRCQKEMKESEMVSAFNYMEKTMTIEGKSEVLQKKQIFCEECTNKIKKAIETK